MGPQAPTDANLGLLVQIRQARRRQRPDKTKAFHDAQAAKERSWKAKALQRSKWYARYSGSVEFVDEMAPRGTDEGIYMRGK